MPVLFLRSYITHFRELHNMSHLPTTVQHVDSAFRDTFTLYARSAEASGIPPRIRRPGHGPVLGHGGHSHCDVTATPHGGPGGAGQRGIQRRPKRAARVTPARREARVRPATGNLGRPRGGAPSRLAPGRACVCVWPGQACVCVAGPSMCVCGRVKRVCVWPGFAAGRAGARGAHAQRLGGICTRREKGAFKRQG